ncbi:GDSL esterase/lipase At5g55050-like isoform X2 [Panicum virgatum]|uniref:GDSL esterase/lipase At5g55050-like isoform X2 n=1 Tax=Panicum virgatum TaxID=38727 RepID=UPI0019D540A9|nr:GDSL esterase/lipase At5g55050-like isoform X2 [Panicum virgatum]
MIMAFKLAMEGFIVLCLVISSMDVLGAIASGVLQPPPIYVLGDSTLDVGNNNFLPGPSVPRAKMYYGIDSPGVPAGRYSNGFNVADFIAKSMGFLSSPPPYLMLAPSTGLLVSTALETGVNYASGGSGILDVTNAWQQIIPLSKQVQYFNDTRAKMVAAVGSAAADALLARSAAQQPSDAAAFLAYLISNYSATITELYAMGARKFAIVNAALIGCTPAARVVSQPLGACAEGVNLLAAGFNVALRSLLATDLAPRLPGLVYSLADSFVLMKDFFADPPAWGFTNIASACCGDGFLLAQSACMPTSKVCPTRYERDQHIFWDPFHFSQRASFLTAQAFYDGPSKYTTPINFMQLAQSI